MNENETHYGDFSEPKETKTSKRSEDVVLSAIKRCELLELKLKKAYGRIEELEDELETAKETIYELEEFQ